MIYLIFTSSINNRYGIINYEHRKNRYLNNIEYVLKLIENDTTIKPIIIENNGFRKTYLDDLKCDICYTDNNQIYFKHKGYNELADIKYIIEKYNIQDEDTIIKLTGRYKLLDLNFIDLVKFTNNIYDTYLKFFNVCTSEYRNDDCVLGLFAIKCKYLKKFSYDLYENLGPECCFAKYVNENIDEKKIMKIEQLNLECNFADNLNTLII